MKSSEDEKPIPEIYEIQCPIVDPYRRSIDCERILNRLEFNRHVLLIHPDHHPDPEPYFEHERQKRFGKK